MPSAPTRQIIVPLIVACALFMQNLDSTIIATALPAIAGALKENPLRLNMAITSYLLSLAIFIPLSGWMADRFGARTVFRAAIAVFTIGSIACGFSNTLPELVAARILQGAGGAMMTPVGRLALFRTVPKSDLVWAMSYLTVPALLGPVIGPPLGGFIVTYGSWRWIFFINVPVGVLGMVLVSLYIENVREAAIGRLDFRGFVLAGIGLAGLMFGFEMVGRSALPVGIVGGLLIGGALFVGLYIAHARHAAHPIIDLALLRIPTFRVATLGGSIFRVGIGALPFLLPMMLQLGFGLNAFASGLITFATSAGAMTMKMTATPVIRLFGFRQILVVNGVLCSLFLFGYGLFRPSTPHFIIFGALLAGGFFRSLQFTSTNTLSFADVPPALMSRASSFASMAQQLSVSIGVGMSALVIHLMVLLRGGGTALEARDFIMPYIVIGLVSLSSIFYFRRLSPEAGAEVSGHRVVVAAPAGDPPPVR